MGGFFLATKKGGGALNLGMAFQSAKLGKRMKLNEDKKKEHRMKTLEFRRQMPAVAILIKLHEKENDTNKLTGSHILFLNFNLMEDERKVAYKVFWEGEYCSLAMKGGEG